jgi:hypothetical protein
MSQYNRSNWEALYGTSGSQFPDNTTGLITELIMRTFGKDLSDSFLNNVSDYQRLTTATGTDTYAVTGGITAYAAGFTIVVKFTNGNTGASTLNVNSLGAKSIVKNGATALASGDIAANQILILTYDGTNFQVVGGVLLMVGSITMNTNRMLGRTTAGSGSTEEIQVQNGLTLSSGSLAIGGAVSSNILFTASGSPTVTWNNVSQHNFKFSADTGDWFNIVNQSDVLALRVRADGNLIFGFGPSATGLIAMYKTGNTNYNTSPSSLAEGQNFVFYNNDITSSPAGARFQFTGDLVQNTGAGSSAISSLFWHVNPNSGSHEFIGLAISPTYQLTGTAAGNIRGIDYNPTVTTMASGTHYALTIGSGRSGFGTRTPTALLHVAAGTASLAPVKLTSGTALTTPADGALEYHNSHLYFTIGSTRHQLDRSPVTLNTDFSQSGTIGTGEDTIYSYSVPANTLATNGDTIIATCSGYVATSVNNKRIRVRFGSTLLFDSGAMAITTAADWSLRLEIVRTTVSTQKAVVVLNTNNSSYASLVDLTYPTETLTGAVTLSVTGEGTSDNDVVKEMAKVRFEPS